jgi:hypothetical protein
LHRIFPRSLGAILAALAFGFGAPATADEGMWPFDQAPLALVRSSLGVSLDGAWLDHLRAASVRLTTGCSASIVSGDGLMLTNHHCLVGCIQHLSSAQRDYMRDGFLTDARSQELTCAGLQAEVLTQIVDVTDPIFEAGRGKVDQAYADAREAAIAQAEKLGCGADERFRCQVISFYRGGQFKLYKFRRYSDVRLVFAPEFEAAFFGGDPDNFNFPRYDLDFAFLRLYDHGQPAVTPDFLAWSATAPAAGDPVFVSGNPGSTERGLTVAQMETLRDVTLPLLLQQQSALRDRLEALADQGPEMRRIVTDALYGVENNIKIFQGREAALRDADFMDARQREEAALKAKLAADPNLAAQIGDPWSEIETAQKAYVRQFAVWRQLEAAAGGGSDLYRYAVQLVRAAAERVKPPAERLPEYADSRLPLLRKALLDPKPISPALERLYLQFWLTSTRDLLGADAPATKGLLGNETPEALAARLADGSKLADPALRRALWRGGMSAIRASKDPMIQYVLAVDPLARAARDVWEDDVTGPVELASERLIRARFALQAASLYPDATYSLRLSYGKVEGWSYHGQDIAPFTTFGGLYGRATGAPPYRLPPRWTGSQGRLDPSAVLDFATTNDITGGSSGSPVVNARGQIVGAAFDGNIYSLAGDFVYDGALNRTVVVSTTAITEALDKVYGRAALLAELSATQPAPTWSVSAQSAAPGQQAGAAR